MNVMRICLGCLLVTAALLTLVRPLSADEPEGVPADTCLLELSLPEKTTVTVDGRDYGNKRRITWSGLRRGKIAVARLKLSHPDGFQGEETILVEGGRRLHLATSRPGSLRPVIIPQIGHEDGRADFARFSPDGKLLATTSRDGGVIVVWDAASGNVLRRLNNDMQIAGLRFSKDGQQLYALGISFGVAVWKVRDGEVGSFLTEDNGQVSGSRVSNDGRYLVSHPYTRGKGVVQVRDVVQNKAFKPLQLYPDATWYDSTVQGFEFRPGSTEVVARMEVEETMKKVGLAFPDDLKDFQKVFDEHRKRRKEWSLLVRWNFVTGQKLQVYQLAGHVLQFWSMAPDGRTLLAEYAPGTATGTNDKIRQLVAWDVESGKELARQPAERLSLSRAYFDDDGINLLSVENGVPQVQSVDARTLAPGAKAIPLPGASGELLAIDRERAQVAMSTYGEQGGVSLWKTEDAAARWTAKAPTRAIRIGFPSRGPRMLAVDRKSVALIDARTQQVVHTVYKGSDYSLGSADFSSDMKSVIVKRYLPDPDKGYEFSFYDAETGRLERSFKLQTGDVQDLTLSPDGTLALGRVENKSVPTGGLSVPHQAIVWETATGRVVSRFQPTYAGKVQDVTAVGFAPNGRSVLVGCHGSNGLIPPPKPQDPAGYLWNPESGESRIRLRVPDRIATYTPHQMHFSTDGQMLVTHGTGIPFGGSDQSICCLWDADGTFLRSFNATCANAGSFTSPDGRLLVVSCDLSGIKATQVFAVDSGTMLRTIPGVAQSFAFDDRLLSVSDRNGDNILVDLSTGAEAVRLARLATEGDWLAITPEGFFDGTERGRQRVAFTIGSSLELVPVDRFFQDYFRPGLLDEVLRGGRPAAGAGFAHQAAPLVKIIAPQAGIRLDEPRITLEVEITNRGGGVKGPWLMHNGSRVLASVDGNQQGKLFRQSLTTALVEGENRLEVRAASSDGSWESEPAVLVVKFDKPIARPSVHLLSIGVNSYKQETMRLSFAAPDARAMAALFESRAPVLYGKEQVRVTQVLDEKATRPGIERALSDVASMANPQDTLVVYLAGHGTTLGQRYYFIPWEFQARSGKIEDDIREQGLAGDVFGDWIEKVPALKRVLIFDTCQSGGALPVSRTARDPFAFRGALERLSHAQGVFTIAAAAAGESAQEIPQLSHGILTYTLLAGAGAITDGPLANQVIKVNAADKVVDIREWFSFAQDKVPLLTKLYLGQEQFIGFSGQGTSFPVLPARE